MAYQPPAISNDGPLSGKRSSSSGMKDMLRRIPFPGRKDDKALIDITRGLAVMLKARLTLVKALETTVAQTSDDRLKKILKKVTRDVHAGRSLSESLRRHPALFDDYYVHLVEVGELAGVLDEILFRLADYMSNMYRLKQKIKMAMIYPVMVLSVAVSAILFLLLVIVPTFAEMYGDFNAELPELTQFVLSVSRWLSSHFIAVGVAMAAAVWGIGYLKREEKIRRRLDGYKIKFPFWGAVYSRALVSRFCKTLGTLLSSGVLLVDGLAIMKKTSENLVLREEIKKLLSRIRKGQSFEKGLADSSLFPPMVIQMITVGEETAGLDHMLLEISDHLDEEVDMKVQGLTSIIEPALIIILGLIIGFLIVAMYLPMFELMNVIQ